VTGASPPAELAIETRGLTKRFGHQAAVAGIDLAVPRGAVFGFLGPNGSGKTTTIRVMLGLAAATSGQVRVLGQEMPHVSYRDNKGRSKVVRYWAMTVRGGEFAPNDEVDRLAWMSIDRAGRKLSYDHDADVLREFVKMVLTK
jgi:ABC-type cobalamin/Fe3+-siderophores transport system ATPase subunit